MWGSIKTILHAALSDDDAWASKWRHQWPSSAGITSSSNSWFMHCMSGPLPKWRPIVKFFNVVSQVTRSISTSQSRHCSGFTGSTGIVLPSRQLLLHTAQDGAERWNHDGPTSKDDECPISRNFGFTTSGPHSCQVTQRAHFINYSRGWQQWLRSQSLTVISLREPRFHFKAVMATLWQLIGQQ